VVRRIRLTAFQNGKIPDFSPAARREAAQRLIDVKLIEREMELGHYARTSDERAKALLSAFTAEHYRGSPEALRLSLAGAALTPGDLQAELAEQVDLLAFLNLRFLPAVDVSDQDIEKYYREKVAPGTVTPGTAASPVVPGDIRANIAGILATERADHDMDAWLQDQRTHTRINYLVKELQ
jgi:hypothetical protein